MILIILIWYIQDKESVEIFKNHILKKYRRIINLWWIESFIGDNMILNMDNEWMLDIIETVLRKIMAMEMIEDSTESEEKVL